MGLIQRLFGKREVPLEPVTVELAPPEVVEWARSHYTEVFGSLEGDIQDFYTQLGEGLKELQEVKKDLAAAGVPAEIMNRRLVKAGRSNRDNLLKNIDILSDKAKLPQDPSPRVAMEFTAEFRSLLDTFFENTMRSQQYVKALFPEEYRLTMDCMHRLNSLLEELSGRLKDVEDKLFAYDRLEEKVGELSVFEEQLRLKRADISDMEGKIGDMQSLIPDRSDYLDNLLSSRQMEYAKELEQNLQDIEKQIGDVDSRARSLISPLSKALDRMEKQDSSGRHVMSPDMKEALEAVRKDAVYALDNDITALLREVSLRVRSGDLGLKDQKAERTLKQVDLLLNNNSLISLKQERVSLLNELDPVKAELELLDIYGEVNDLKKELESLRYECNRLAEALEDEKDQLESLDDEKNGLKFTLKADMEKIFGYTFVID